MVRKITHILLVLSFLFGGIVSVAPMAFCQMTETAVETSDCCEKSEIAAPTHCTPDADTTCPVCTQNICNSDVSPQIKVSNETNKHVLLLLAVLLPTDALISSGHTASTITADSYHTITGPPIYLSNQVFRL